MSLPVLKPTVYSYIHFRAGSHCPNLLSCTRSVSWLPFHVLPHSRAVLHLQPCSLSQSFPCPSMPSLSHFPTGQLPASSLEPHLLSGSLCKQHCSCQYPSPKFPQASSLRCLLINPILPILLDSPLPYPYPCPLHPSISLCISAVPIRVASSLVPSAAHLGPAVTGAAVCCPPAEKL